MELVNSVPVAGTFMKFIRCGRGKTPLVVLPGMSLIPASTFAPAVAASFALFGDDYTVYVFDRKEEFTEGYSIEEMAEDTAAVFKALGIENACVYGASQGGMIAQVLAIRHPELVGKLVLASTFAFCTEKSAESLLRWEELARMGDVQALNHDAFSYIYSEEYLEKNKAAFDWLEKRGMPEQVEKFGILARACRRFDCREGLATLKMPVLALGSRLDRLTFAEGTEEIAALTGCESYLYEGYSHAVYDEAPDFFARLKTFFDA